MIERKVRHLYDRLGPRYPHVFLAIQATAGVLVALGAIALLASYYEPSFEDAALIVLTASVFTVAGVAYAVGRSRPMFNELVTWRNNPEPTPAETVAAWEAATTYPTRSWRRDSWRVNTIAIVPSVIAMLLILDLEWTAFPVLVGATWWRPDTRRSSATRSPSS